MQRSSIAAAALALATAIAAPAQAFCGFYVGGATADLTSNATLVVLLREGTRTVLSMQNNYQGPTSDFALVVPVPVVLQKDNVKTLPNDIFKEVDRLAAPRLVETWEQDPCPPPRPRSVPEMLAAAQRDERSVRVRVEAQFAVGEYDIVILGSDDALALEGWLTHNRYKIPPGAAEHLRPYVQSGMKFFVAKVDISKVKKEGDKTMLSPLRFHYDTDRFELPVRLGLINSPGKQDLLIHILARGKRYEVANYPNTTIPTNLDVGENIRDQFGSFYAALFDQTLAHHPGAVVTEYAWDPATCDPCPGAPLGVQAHLSLGLDVLPKDLLDAVRAQSMRRRWLDGSGWVLTRLHARLSRDAPGQDLVFREARPIDGGRELLAPDGKLSQGAEIGSTNRFQARYAIRHPWQGPIPCKDPSRGNWGSPPRGTVEPGLYLGSKTAPASELLFGPRPREPLARYLLGSVPELGLLGEAQPPSPVPLAAPQPALAEPLSCPAPDAAPSPLPPAPRGCAGCAVPASGADLGSLAALASAALAGAVRRGARGRQKNLGSRPGPRRP